MGRHILRKPSNLAEERVVSPRDGNKDVLNNDGLRDCCVGDEIGPSDAENASLTLKGRRLEVYGCCQL